VVRASDLRLNGCEFDPRPPHYRLVGTIMADRRRVDTGHTISVGNPSPRLTQPLILRGK